MNKFTVLTRFVFKHICLLFFLLFCHFAKLQAKDSIIMQKSMLVSSSDTFSLEDKNKLILFALNFQEDTLKFHYLNQSSIVLNKKQIDTIFVYYRDIIPEFLEPYALNKIEDMDSNIVFKTIADRQLEEMKAVEMNDDRLNIQGTYGRSFAIGNNQDLSMDAAFNIQINGYLLDSIKIEAALTDQHLPFQPEGNTQQIQEFDQLYIKLSKNRHALTAGDFVLKNRPSIFLKTEKKIQGLQYVLEESKSENKYWKHQSEINLSVTKGSFHQNKIQGEEANQGPYKLQGANGEIYFIVLSGSEKVFIDDELLVRGEENDYIIDYNTAEVTFMPKRPITKDSRIHIEFEYQDKNYFNTLLHTFYQANYKDKFQIGFQLYSNQDAKNQSYLQELSPEQKEFLRTQGNQDVDLLYPSWREDTIGGVGITYVFVDTLVQGVAYDSVLVYNPNSDQTQFQVQFTHVGIGNGDYKLSSYAGNGKVFEWVPPEQGIAQGEYAPIIPLVSPQMHQVLSVYSNYKIDSLKNIGLEWVGSHKDPNLFAPLNMHQNTGQAFNLAYEAKKIYNVEDSIKAKSEWVRQVHFQMVESNFDPLEPFRNREFGRDWNTAIDSNFHKEWILGIESNLKNRYLKNLQLKNYSLSKDFQSFSNKTDINGAIEIKNWELISHSSFLLQNPMNEIKWNTFLKPDVTLLYFLDKGEKRKNLLLQYKSEHLKNKSENALYAPSFNFHEIKTGTNLQFNSWKTDFYYKWRRDENEEHGELKKYSESHELGLEFGVLEHKNHSLHFQSTYRWLEYFQELSNDFAAKDQNILGRLDYQGNYFQNGLEQQIVFDFGSGQEQKKSFIYVKVPTGQGQYMWVDYNGDGIEQANEFELAIYEDQKQYMRILTPTNDYILVNYSILQYRMSLRMDKIFVNNKASKFVKALSLFSNQFQMQFGNRIQASEGLKTINPFYFPDNIEDLVHKNYFLNNQFTYRSKNKKWFIDVIYRNNANAILLYYGLEQSNNFRQSLRTRWNINSSWRLALEVQNGEKFFKSEEAVLRNYKSKSQFIEPEISYQIASFFRMQINYRWEEKQQEIYNGIFPASLHQIELESKIAQLKWGFINLKLSGILLNTSDEIVESPLNMVLLEGLQKGKNMLWNIQWERSIGKGMNFSIYYEGRAMEGRKPIHTARVSLRALL